MSSKGFSADTIARVRRIMRTSFVGIAANVLLAAFKATVGFAAGSVAVVMDAVNNLSDALGSVLTLAGIQLARRPPSAKHPFGYGRIEYFSAVSIAALVLAAGAGSFVESIRKIVNPSIPEFGIVSLAVVSVAVVAKLVLGRYVSAQGRACNSDALVASGADATFDAVLTAATLVGALLVKFAGLNLDGWIGAVISLFILKAGAGMLMESVGNIMGNRPDAEVSKKIRDIVEAVPGVIGAYDLILHNYGPDTAIGSIHVEIDGSLDAAAIHRLTHAVQRAVLDAFHVFLTVGIYAIDPARSDDIAAIATATKAHPGVKAVHGVFFDDDRAAISFDVLVDFTVRDRAALREAILADLASRFPDRSIAINFDTDYSD